MSPKLELTYNHRNRAARNLSRRPLQFIARRYKIGAYKGDAIAETLEKQGLNPLVVLRDQDNAQKLLDGQIDLWATGNVFLPGHAIRLDLAGSNWPRYSVSDPAGGRPVEITLHHDAGHRSVLTLPVLPSAAVGL